MLPLSTSSRATSLRKRTSSSAWRICLCWVLCLSVWRGPVPIVHEHGLDLQSLGNNAGLAEHAIEYHADKLGEQSPGFHLHMFLFDGCAAALLADSSSSDSSSSDCDSSSGGLLAMSGEPASCDGCGCQAFGADNELRFEQLMRAALDARCNLNRLSCGEVPNVEAQPRFSSTADMSFLQTQLSGATACALLCVFLC